SDSTTRLEALRQEVRPEVLARAAMKDTNYHVRRAAVLRIEDQEVLAAVARTDTCEAVRQAAVERIADEKLLAGIALEAQSQGVRVAAVSRIHDPKTAMYLVKQHPDATVRAAAVRQVKDEALLYETVLKSPFSHTRVAAVRRLAEPETLVAVCRSHTDNQVRLAASRRLFETGGGLDPFQVRAACAPLVEAPPTHDPDLLGPYLAAMARITDPQALETVARTGKNALLRWQAVSQIDDYVTLSEIAGTDKSDRVRETAVRRIHHPEELAGLARSDTCYRVRIAAISRVANPATLMVACMTDEDPRVRLAAVAMLEDHELLHHAWRNNSMPMVQKAAAKKLAGQPLVLLMERLFPGGFANGRMRCFRPLPKCSYTQSELLAVFNTAALSVLARMDEPASMAKVERAATDKDLAKLTLSASNPLVRVAAVERISSPAVLYLVAGRAMRAKGQWENAPERDVALWAVLEKLATPGLLDHFGFGLDYVKRITSHTLLMVLMASDVFPDVRVAAENRYQTLLSQGQDAREGGQARSRRVA
ncbi:MAG: hypothetical protein JRI97_06615, partial [Deltaproteobacteria bacterium]|nr:hypothetical protein [Deltaproteobacteria bacterium]